MLHTADPKVADTEEFAKLLRDADAVWFDGGRQWNIVDSYANTLTYREFHKVLERGGVIGGSSAGATIQGDYLVRGDTSGPDIMMTPGAGARAGFKFLRKVAIDQHINTRIRWDDLIPVIKKYPDLLGIGLSEGTAIVVKGDRFEVMGAWKVAIHDNTRALSAVGEALLRAVGRRRLQHEDAQDREIRHRRARPRRRPRRALIMPIRAPVSRSSLALVLQAAARSHPISSSVSTSAPTASWRAIRRSSDTSSTCRRPPVASSSRRSARRRWGIRTRW